MRGLVVRMLLESAIEGAAYHVIGGLTAVVQLAGESTVFGHRIFLSSSVATVVPC